jgi:hypothetical protein
LNDKKHDKSNLSAASAAGVLKAPNLSFLISSTLLPLAA